MRGENEEQGTIWQASEFHALDKKNGEAEWSGYGRLVMNLGSEVVRS